ncbi:MAG: tetratricopeptide repeat protein, partial [Candidatus Nitrosocosmicus sp.]
FYNKGMALSALSKFAEATTSFEKAIEINPYFADAFYNKGMALSALSKFAEATTSFEKAIEINPYFADAFYNKGMALSALSKFAEAMLSFDKALEIDSEYVKALNGKSWILAYHFPSRMDEALEIIKRAMGIDPTDIDVLYTYGYILENMGSYNESVSIYRHILKQDPLIPEVWYRCFISKKQTADADLPHSDFYLDQAIDLDSNYATLSKMEGQRRSHEKNSHFSIPFLGL